MVSVHPTPPPGQDFYGYYMGGEDPMRTKRTQNSGFSMTSSSSSCWNSGAAVEDHSKRVRKPYTITKSRESWSEQEHDKFLEALHLFDRDWKKIEAFVGSKTVIQIRSHAQKYFLKVQKNGTSEHVPPPRPKRKASHPYPQKASRNVCAVASILTGPLQSSAALLESGYALRLDSVSVPEHTITNAPLYSWTYNGEAPRPGPHISKGDCGSSGVTIMHNCSSSSNELAPRWWTSTETNRPVKEQDFMQKRVMPDFAQVYSFLGSVFDPSASNHLLRLKKMSPVNVETVVMLMKNLSVNLRSPEFENHKIIAQGTKSLHEFWMARMISEISKLLLFTDDLCQKGKKLAVLWRTTS
ncbi:UNVERIFIED_CONTAM: protein REVEILLE 6 [Sesamum radiatum]|uniref:Protein REVEILLE 6 n=1 Tax=Sesamum radiatum TaxID=300843 RepID=A0AAW2VCM8_SESRA